MPLPGLLRDVMGVTVEDYVPMYWQKQGVKFSQALSGPDATCEVWFDVLKPSGAEVLANYTMGAHAGKPAITNKSFGKGKAIYIGAKLDEASLHRVVSHFAAASGIRPEIEAPQGVEVTARGKRTFLLNHSAKSQTVKLPRSYKDALTGKSADGSVDLEAYGVRVLQQE
jgi:beta-galactosidase